jgi:dienelactone hydrolase
MKVHDAYAVGVRLAIGGLAASLVLASAACGGSSARPAQPPRGPFSYDGGKPLAFADRGRVNHGYPIAVRDVSYSAGRDRVEAFLVLPPARDTRLPAAVYLHGSGGDREQFVVQATWLAARGAVTMSITAPSAVDTASASSSPLTELRREARLEARDVVAVRRAIDLLRHRPDVDPRRIGFVGWSAGARTGAILAGVEPRLRAIVLMSGGATPVSAYAARAPEALRPAITRYLGRVDPLRYIRRAHGSALLLQDGRRDEIVPRAALEALARAAPKGTELGWYDSKHALNVKAYRYQLAWLARKLAISGPPVKGALTGP